MNSNLLGVPRQQIRAKPEREAKEEEVEDWHGLILTPLNLLLPCYKMLLDPRTEKITKLKIGVGKLDWVNRYIPIDVNVLFINKSFNR